MDASISLKKIEKITNFKKCFLKNKKLKEMLLLISKKKKNLVLIVKMKVTKKKLSK